MKEDTQQTHTKLKGLLGLAMRAGQIVSGQEATLGYIRKKSIVLTLIDETVSESSYKKISQACKEHSIPLCCLPGGLVGQAVGKQNRTVVGVLPGSFADTMLEKTKHLYDVGAKTQGLVGGRINE